MGDGALLYLGYPRAHEDDAERAVRTGLGVIDAVGRLDMRMLRRREMKREIKVALAAAIVAFAWGGQTLGGTTTIQRSMTTTNGSGASCSQADDCGSCSISCPVGKSAICQSGSDRPAESQNRPRCAPPTCFCQ